MAAFSGLAVACTEPAGQLSFVIVDAADGTAIPARVELLDAADDAHVPADAVQVAMECALPPFPEPLQQIVRRRSLVNPATGTRQFYVAGPMTMDLSPGDYRLRAFVGIEYGVGQRAFSIASDERLELEVPVRRRADPSAAGWYAADGHLHLTRLTPQDDRAIGEMMRAEGLHVANLLQLGTQKHFDVTPQYAFGEAAIHREGETLLISGQEHPRSHVWGHTVILGANRALDLRDTYAVNERFWRAARREGGLAGYAHHGLGNAHDGLLVDGPSGLISFVEVLQFELPYYDVWYELLNLGIRLTPTAGTDFPCGFYGLPGRERFYTRVEGDLTRQSWLAGIEAGRTFVTNGPLLQFTVGGADIGETLRLHEPRPVVIAGRVEFDRERDTVDRIELVHDGEVQRLAVERGEGWAAFSVERRVSESGWLALRVSGLKLNEQPFAQEGRWDRFFFEEIDARVSGGCSTRELRDFRASAAGRPTAAHTAPIHVVVDGSQPLTARPRARVLARRALARLDALEDRLAEPHLIQRLLRNLTYTDGIPAHGIRDNRAALDRATGAARRHYRALAADGEN